jgi:hypothetical protein
MGYLKFAPLTASLLVRKGEASPSSITGQIGSRAQMGETGMDMPAARAINDDTRAMPAFDAKRNRFQTAQPNSNAARESPPRAQPAERGAETSLPPRSLSPARTPQKKRRVVIAMDGEEYERLGIAAVKTRTSRHQLARAALFARLDAIAREHGACSCIAGGPCACK